MSDLVEALHLLTTWVPCEWKHVCTEAADEIERLQTKLDNIVRDFGHIEAVKERAKRKP
jgi:hypothetical protein